MKTLVDIPEKQIHSLSELCDKYNISRAEAIRRAIDLFIKNNKQPPVDAFGAWKNNSDDRLSDGIRYQEKLRDEW